MKAPENAGGEPDFELTARSDGVEASTTNGVETADRFERYPSGNSSSAGAVANFVNTIVGAGIVGIPFATAQSGLWAGIFMICLAALLNVKSTTMLITAGEKVGRLNYEELMEVFFGSAGTHVFTLFAGVLAFGAMSAYLIIVGDTVPMIAHASGIDTGALADRASVIGIVGVFCMLPLSLLKDLSKLAYTSCLSVLADVLLTVIVLVAASGAARELPDVDRSDVNTFIRPTIFAGFGAISFSFVCQHSSFLVYRSMSERGVDRWATVTRWSVSIALVMSLTLGVAGYLSFADGTEGNILNNFTHEHMPATVARAFLALTMVFTYPLEMYVARHVLDASLFQTCLGKGPITTVRHYWITVIIWALTLTLALSTANLGSVLEIFGAFGASAIGYVLPPLLYMKSCGHELRQAKAAWNKDSSEYEPALTERLWVSRNFIVPVFMVLFGVVAMVAGVVTAVVGELSHTKA